MGLEIHIYDFDGTLFRSPSPPEGWAHGSAWWADPESLNPPCVPGTPSSSWWINSVVGQAKRSISSSNVWAVLCTGRLLASAHRFRVPELLKQKGLAFDQVLLNPGGDTQSYKGQALLKLLRRFPDVQKVQVWEDTTKNLSLLEKVSTALGVDFEGHRVRATAGECSSAGRVARQYLTRLKHPDVEYIGAFLTPMARQRLLRDFPAVHANVHADHMTIKYHPNTGLVESLRIGRHVKLKVIGYAEDEKGQAVLVVPKGAKSMNTHPHITVSSNVPAVYSNTLLGRGWEPVNGPTLDAVLDTYPRRYSR